MPLWHMHSEILQGFYASEVYVSADNKQSARSFAAEAFDRHIKEMEDDFHCNFLVSELPWEGGYEAQVKDLKRRFYDETDKLEELEHLAVIFKKT